MRIKLSNVTLSYVKLLEPEASFDREPEYSASLIIYKDNKEVVEAFNKALKEMEPELQSKCKGGKLPAVWISPLKDSDQPSATGSIRSENNEEYKNSYYINVRSKTKVKMIDIYHKDINSDDEIFSGCVADVVVNLYPYNYQNVKVGIGCNLLAVKVKDKSKRFSGGAVDIDEMFGAPAVMDSSDDDLL